MCALPLFTTIITSKHASQNANKSRHIIPHAHQVSNCIINEKAANILTTLCTEISFFINIINDSKRGVREISKRKWSE